MGNKKVAIWVIIVLVIVAGIVIYFNQKKNGGNGGQQNPQVTPTPTPPEESTGNVKYERLEIDKMKTVIPSAFFQEKDTLLLNNYIANFKDNPSVQYSYFYQSALTPAKNETDLRAALTADGWQLGKTNKMEKITSFSGSKGNLSLGVQLVTLDKGTEVRASVIEKK